MLSKFLKLLVVSLFLVSSNAVAEADGDLTASGAVTEPIALTTTADTTGEAVDIFDFTLSDGGTSDGLTMDISQIVLNTSGTGTFSKVTFRLNGPDAVNVVGVVGGITITFSGLTISVADGLSETYTVNAYYNDNTGLTEGQSFILNVDGDTDITSSGGTTMGATTPVNNGSGTTVNVAATQLVFSAQPSSVILNANMGPVTLEAQDTAGNVDTGFTETVTLTDENQGGEADGAGALATTSNAGSLAVAAVSGQVFWANLTYNAVANINIDANSTSFNVESSNISISGDADGTLVASATVTEPIALATTVTNTGAAVDIFDFTLTDGGTSDGLAMAISQIVLNTSGTGAFSKVTFRLNGPDATNVVGVVGGSTITFSGLTISVADGLSETYTVNAFYNDNTGLTEGQTFIVSVDGDTDVTSSGGTTMAATAAVNNGSGSTVNVVATQLVFSAQPSSVLINANMGPVTLQAQDAAGNVDTDFTETVTLTDENQGGETDGAGALATTSNGTSLAVAAVSGQVSWANLTYNAVANINIDANSTSFNIESSNISITGDADGTLVASATVTEPRALLTTVTTTGAAVDIFDFTLTDGGTGDGLAMAISQIVLNTSGTGTFSKVTFRLNGPDATNVVGIVGGSTITFSGLTISVADGASETYTVNAYYNDNTGLTEGQTFIVSVDGDTDVTSSGGSTMGVTAAVNNGSGSTVNVIATQLAFSAQPSSVILNANMGTVTLQAQDAAGNVDTGFTETVTLTDEDQGAETDAAGTLATTSNGASLAVAAVSGQVSWANLTYNAIANINVDANSISFNVESSNTSITDDGDLTASATVTEPIALATTVTTAGAAVNIFDFILSDGGTSDASSMDISQIVLNTSGTGAFSKVTFRLNGPDAANVVGVVGGSTITFSGLSISVANGLSETYTVNAFYNDNTGLTEAQTFILSVDGDTDVTSSGGTAMGVTSAVNNGTGSTVNVTATQLVFSAQPSSVAPNANMGTVTLQAQDAAGNVDTGFTETVTLTDENQGAETDAAGALATTSNGASLAVAAVSGQVSWPNLTYGTAATINIDANSTSFNVESSAVTIAVAPPPPPPPTTAPTPEPDDNFFEDNTDSNESDRVIKVPVKDDQGDVASTAEISTDTSLNPTQTVEENKVSLSVALTDQDGEAKTLNTHINNKGEVGGEVTGNGDTTSFSSTATDTQAKMLANGTIETQTKVQVTDAQGQVQSVQVTSVLHSDKAEIKIDNGQSEVTQLNTALGNSKTTISADGQTQLETQLPNGEPLVAIVNQQGHSDLKLGSGTSQNQILVNQASNSVEVKATGEVDITSKNVPITGTFTFNGEQKELPPDSSARVKIAVITDNSVKVLFQLLNSNVVVEEAEPISGLFYQPGTKVEVTIEQGLPVITITTKISQKLVF